MGVPPARYCVECGAQLGKRSKPIRSDRCPACGIEAAARAAAEMHAKSGPAWEAWLLRPGKGANVAAAGVRTDSPAD